MYLGSVKFYKHLIYITMILILVLAVIGLIFLISIIIPDSSVEAANIDNINNTSYNQTESNDSHVDDNDNQASSEPNDSLNIGKSYADNDTSKDSDESKDSQDSEEPLVFDKYPELYCDNTAKSANENKTAYLTFDDGPSANTKNILSILKEYNIKATFFVITGGANSANLDMLKEIDKEGHAIGIHTHSHIYKEIYDSVDSFLEDMNSSFNIIYEATNKKPTVLRFPGGSINDINTNIYEDITNEVLKRNFSYFDWNVSFEDAKNNTIAEQIYESALDGITKNDGNNLVILAHDRANDEQTLEALKKIIDVLKSNGYAFDKLDNSVEPVTFSYK